MVDKRHWSGLIAALVLAGCASQGDVGEPCGEVSTFYQPPETQNLYKVVVTRIDDDNVISKPNYQLAPGTYQLRLVELIDDPRLSVSLRNRGYKELTLTVKAGTRYHLAARFNTDKRFQGPSREYWDPVVWRESTTECRMKP
ncbi:conserved hypothetical protein [Ferrimonas balearica DSM 9799]|uniref:Lipoprotein n=1 Tax=Ferrimonas balearica (strain DSM 9799 / CCM 4581 / KCTC 23876 / PAT) TaxID=550540 RepID=E1ST23_FERBD|nr:hypothetical protein [Ferrimonas balearica]ADN75079.1 conserved hypothetical protein [Ferrimonas balearica DSM 9799]